MIIPNGLTLRVMNKRPKTRTVGNAVISPREIEFVHFTTTKELRDALRLEGEFEIRIDDPIPQEIKDLLAMPEDDAVVEHPDRHSGLLYRDEFYRYQKQMGYARIQVVAADLTDAKVGDMWIVDPTLPVETPTEGGTI